MKTWNLFSRKMIKFIIANKLYGISYKHIFCFWVSADLSKNKYFKLFIESVQSKYNKLCKMIKTFKTPKNRLQFSFIYELSN